MRAYLQLFRLPNVFTALADVLMGAFFVRLDVQELLPDAPAPPNPYLLFGLLLVASACLYTAGMVLNDVFDYEIDAVERPGRPLPSGRIDRRWAGQLGAVLLGFGLLPAPVTTVLLHDVRPFVMAVALGTLVLLYDRWLKHTPLGPVAMGGCRSLNVLLGMSAIGAGQPWHTAHYIVAAGIGIYICGLTAYARSEAATSGRGRLLVSTVVLALGLLLLANFDRWMDPFDLEGLIKLEAGRWQLLWILLGGLIVWRFLRGVMDPRPSTVQAAIKQGIFSLIMLDAVVAFAVRGLPHAMIIVLLLIPTMLLGRWIYST